MNQLLFNIGTQRSGSKGRFMSIILLLSSYRASQHCSSRRISWRAGEESSASHYRKSRFWHALCCRQEGSG